MTQGLTLFLFGVNSDACTIFQPYFNWKYLLYLLIFGKRRVSKGLFSGSAGKRICLQCRRPWFNSWVGKIRWRRDRLPTPVVWGFPCGSVGKEYTCNAGDPGSIPGLGRSIGEGIGYPAQDSWTSLVAQLLKNPPAMWEKCFLVLHCSHSLLKDYNFYLKLISLHLENEKFSHFQTKT